MPDCSMCDGINNEGKMCPLAETCYRYMAEPNEYQQSYFCDAPHDGYDCDWFWEFNK